MALFFLSHVVGLILCFGSPMLKEEWTLISHKAVFCWKPVSCYERAVSQFDRAVS